MSKEKKEIIQQPLFYVCPSDRISDVIYSFINFVLLPLLNICYHGNKSETYIDRDILVFNISLHICSKYYVTLKENNFVA